MADETVKVTLKGKDGPERVIPLGFPPAEYVFAPGKPVEVPAAEAARFESDPNYTVGGSNAANTVNTGFTDKERK